MSRIVPVKTGAICKLIFIQNELPGEMRAPLTAQGDRGGKLRDNEHAGAMRDPCLEQMKRCVGYLEEHVFPKIL